MSEITANCIHNFTLCKKVRSDNMFYYILLFPEKWSESQSEAGAHLGCLPAHIVDPCGHLCSLWYLPVLIRGLRGGFSESVIIIIVYHNISRRQSKMKIFALRSGFVGLTAMKWTANAMILTPMGSFGSGLTRVCLYIFLSQNLWCSSLYIYHHI